MYNGEISDGIEVPAIPNPDALCTRMIWKAYLLLSELIHLLLQTDRSQSRG